MRAPAQVCCAKDEKGVSDASEAGFGRSRTPRVAAPAPSRAHEGDPMLLLPSVPSLLAPCSPALFLPSSPCGWTPSYLSSAWRTRSASRPSTTTIAAWPTTATQARSHWSWWGPRVSGIRAAGLTGLWPLSRQWLPGPCFQRRGRFADGLKKK